MCSVIYAAPKPSYFGSQETKNFRPLSSSPYSDLTSASQWQNIEQQFAKEFCKLLGLSQDPPLYIVSNIGATALPTMIKLKSLMDERRKERPKVEIWSIEDELPVLYLLTNEATSLIIHRSKSHCQRIKFTIQYLLVQSPESRLRTKILP